MKKILSIMAGARRWIFTVTGVAGSYRPATCLADFADQRLRPIHTAASQAPTPPAPTKPLAPSPEYKGGLDLENLRSALLSLPAEDIKQLGEDGREVTTPSLTASSIEAPQPAPGGENAGEQIRHYRLLKGPDLKSLPRMDWTIKGILPKRGVSQIRGPSMAAKSFLGFGMGCAAAEGSAWFGYRVKKTPVVYVQLEGEAGARQRVEAWEKHNGRPLPEEFSMILQPFSIITKEDIENLAAVTPKGALVIIDTQNRAAPLIDENTSQGMGKVIVGASNLAALIEGHVVLITHTGKDASRGPRGHSSQIPAFDAAIEVSRNGEIRTWRADKVKDGLDGATHTFRLEVIDLGIDEDGDKITSCIISTDNMPPTASATMNHSEQMVVDLLNRAGGRMIIADLREAFTSARLERKPDAQKNTIKNAWLNAKKALVAKQILIEDGIYLSIVKPS
jgi:hypothetical protein